MTPFNEDQLTWLISHTLNGGLKWCTQSQPLNGWFVRVYDTDWTITFDPRTRWLALYDSDDLRSGWTLGVAVATRLAVVIGSACKARKSPWELMLQELGQ